MRLKYNPLAEKDKSGLLIDRVGSRTAGGVFLGCGIGAGLTAGAMAIVIQATGGQGLSLAFDVSSGGWGPGQIASVVSLGVASVLCIPIGIASLSRAESIETEIERRKMNGRWLVPSTAVVVGPAGISLRF